MNEITNIKETELLAPSDPMMDMIGKAIATPDLPIERLTALMDMRERQMNKEAEQAFNQAFAAAMAEMPDVPKSGKNTHSKQTYSTLDDLIRTTRPVLAPYGLSLNWQTEANGNEYNVTAIVRHSMGHCIKTTLTGARDTGKQMNALQGGGSTETYLKRYTGFSILGLSSGDEVDDDGRGNTAATTISAEQFVALRDKLELAKVDAAKVCLAHGCASLEQFPSKDFQTAMSRLENDIKAKAASNE